MSCEEKFKKYSAKILEQQKQIQKLEDQSGVQNSIIRKLGKRSQELALLVKAYKRSEASKFTQQLPTNRHDDFAVEFSEGEIVSSEFEVNQYTSYTYNAIYSLGNSLTHSPAVRPMPKQPMGKEYHNTVNFAVGKINEELEDKNMFTSDFDLIDGITRIDRLKGAQYDLYFRTNQLNVYHRARAYRPFSPLQLVGNIETIDTNHDIINLILPLSGRIDKFKLFMENFLAVCIRWDRRVYLTIVFFGLEGKIELQNIASNISQAENFTNYQIVYSDKPFSRGLGLQKGALAWDKGNVLMFFCDVDVYFNPEFLERCRFYTAPGHQVYYPIVFSLYNPVVVYGGNSPPLKQQYRINRETGYWRDFGFGMACHYRSDFLQTGGFDLSIKGWGKEDVKLYRKYLNSKIKVVRAVDRGIFHMYHHKHCSRNLTDSQYISCLNSKVKSEASHTQMGLLAFAGHIFENNDPNWIEQLQQSATKNISPTTQTTASSNNSVNKVDMMQDKEKLQTKSTNETAVSA
jgi:chondroitin sulfate N-acetylgalactosaminyltransferase 1/2